MIVTCNDCDRTYDDARRWTTCPHDPLMSDHDLEQKDAGIALAIAGTVRFNHMTDADVMHVQSCGWNGMVTLRELPGEFAPHLFVVVK